MISPSVEQIRERLHKAVEGVIRYRQHLTGCAIYKTDFCSCGLRESMDELHETWHSSFTLLDTLSRELEEVKAALAHEHEVSRNDPAEQRAERYAVEAYELSGKLIEAESALAAMREERDNAQHYRELYEANHG